jgi:NADH:ubiquinone oxidoreductase subunit K
VQALIPLPTWWSGDDIALFYQLAPASQNTTGLVALGGELFGARLLSLQLLGLLLLVAFLVSLRLLAESFRRPPATLLPRLGATAVAGALVYSTFQTPFGGDGYLTLALLLLAPAFGALVSRRYAFLQCFLLLEGAGLSVNLLFAAAAASNESLEAETLVVTAVAVAAAETAVGLAAFLAISQGGNERASRKGPEMSAPSSTTAPTFAVPPLPRALVLTTLVGPLKTFTEQRIGGFRYGACAYTPNPW